MAPSDEAVSLLRSYLNKRMRVVISDGRIIDGNFLCTDRGRNMVLGHCEEFSSTRELAEVEANPASKLYQPRSLGLAIVPGDHIRSIALAQEAQPPDPQLTSHPPTPSQEAQPPDPQLTSHPPTPSQEAQPPDPQLASHPPTPSQEAQPPDPQLTSHPPTPSQEAQPPASLPTLTPSHTPTPSQDTLPSTTPPST